MPPPAISWMIAPISMPPATAPAAASVAIAPPPSIRVEDLAADDAADNTGYRVACSAEALVRHCLASSVTADGTDDQLNDKRRNVHFGSPFVDDHWLMPVGKLSRNCMTTQSQIIPESSLGARKISIGVFAFEQGKGSSRQNLDVKHQRPVIDVVEIVFDPLFDFFARIGFTAPAIDLRPSGDSGPNLMAGEITIDYLFVKRIGGLGLGGMGARAYQRDLAS